MQSNNYYSFEDKYNQGLIGEKKMDDYFKHWFDIEIIEPKKQLLEHYDRLFTPKKENNLNFKVEYKTDFAAIKTRNFFIETESSTGYSQGWIYKTKADWISILVSNQIYLAEIEALRKLFRKNINLYPKRKSKPTPCHNGFSYYSTGYLMPLTDLKLISKLYFIN